jgi:hypothetical protein
MSATEVYDLIDAGTLRARRTRHVEEIRAASVVSSIAAQRDALANAADTVGEVTFYERDHLRHLWTCSICDQPVMKVDRSPHAHTHRPRRPRPAQGAPAPTE